MHRITNDPNPSGVAHIRIDYTDGSFDEIKLIQEGDFPLFSLHRNQPGIDNERCEAHTGGAIASLLYITLATNQHTKYSCADTRVLTLSRCWQEIVKKVYS